MDKDGRRRTSDKTDLSPEVTTAICGASFLSPSTRLTLLFNSATSGVSRGILPYDNDVCPKVRFFFPVFRAPGGCMGEKAAKKDAGSMPLL